MKTEPVERETEWNNTVARFFAGLTDRKAQYLEECYTQRELLEYAVDFACGKPLAGGLAKAHDIPLPPAALPAIIAKELERIGGSREPSRHYEDFLARHREELRANLTLALSKNSQVAIVARLSPIAAQGFDPVVSYEMVLRKGSARLRHLHAKRAYIGFTLAAILAYVVLQLLDDGLDHGADLRACALPDCDRRPFFFAGGGLLPQGRPQVYCCPAHRQAANRLNTAERMRARRRSAKRK
jgi:hypothetical protein